MGTVDTQLGDLESEVSHVRVSEMTNSRRGDSMSELSFLANAPHQTSGETTSAPAPEPSAEAVAGLAALDRATMRLIETVGTLDETLVRRPSLLPGWSRAHVISHLARNADAYLNLLRWARTGVESPMYASRADRDADIEEGARRSYQVLAEDLLAASTRLADAARALPASAWSAEVVVGPGKPMPARRIPRERLREVWVHLVDLDHGVWFDDLPESDLEPLLEDVVSQFGGRPDVPRVEVVTTFGQQRRERTWALGTPPTAPSQRVQGSPGVVLGWLLGRSDGNDLDGSVPRLPPWL